MITKKNDSEENSNTYWLALSVKLHRTIIGTQSAMFCFPLLFHDHVIIYIGSEQICPFSIGIE